MKLVSNADYEYMAFPLSNDANLYKDDFDSSEQSEEKEPTMHGFEMARFIFKESHTD